MDKHIERTSMPILSSANSRIPSIRWSVIAGHERQAMANHYQTLEQLAGRGGLSPCEAVAIIEDRQHRRMDLVEAERRLLELCEADSAARASQAPAPSPLPVAGLGSITNEDDGVLTLRFKDESAACAFMDAYVPTVDCREMPRRPYDDAPSPAASIDTNEFRELLEKFEEVTNNGDEARWAWEAFVAHIDAHCTRLASQSASAKDAAPDVALLLSVRRYVAGAYECAFPDAGANDIVLQDLDAAIDAARAALTKADQ